MAELKGMMLQLASRYYSPKQLLQELNKNIYGNIERKVFVTMTYGVIDISERRFTFCRAGHNPLLKIEANNAYQRFVPEGVGPGLNRGTTQNLVY